MAEPSRMALDNATAPGPGPLVTVGIPMFNAHKTVELAVKSVLMQTYRNLEVIVLDDGSRDGSIESLEPTCDERVRIVRGDSNRGLSFRLNQLSALATGTYVARMDADDLMHPCRIARQVAFLQQHPDIDVVGTGMYLIDERNRIYGYSQRGNSDFTKHSILRGGYLVHPSVMGKRDWFLKHPYSSSFLRAEDRELWLRTCSVSKFAEIPDPLLFYRQTSAPRTLAYLAGAATLSRLTWANREPARSSEALAMCLRYMLAAPAFSCAARLGIVDLVRKVRMNRVAKDACVEDGLRVLSSIIPTVQ